MGGVTWALLNGSYVLPVGWFIYGLLAPAGPLWNGDNDA